MQSNSPRVTLISLPLDIICYLALNYLDYNSAVNLFKEIIIKHFSIQNPLIPNENLFDELKRYRSSPPFDRCEEVCKKLLPKIVAGEFTSFYFSPKEGWFVWGEYAKILTGVESHFPQKLTISLKNNTSQLWQNTKLKIVDIVSRGSRILFLTDDGKVYQLEIVKKEGHLEFVKELVGEKIVKLALGHDHILALTNHGQVYSWGCGSSGQLGLGNDEYQKTPRLINVLKKLKIADIFAGNGISFCLSQEGKVYAFGDNTNGELGLGDTENVFTPKLITSLQHEKIISIACHSWHTLFLGEKGKVFSSGKNEFGTLGLGEMGTIKKPTLINSLSNIKKIAVGVLHSFCVDAKGKLYGFGGNANGQLGLEINNESIHSTPQLVTLSEDEIITEVATGAFHTLCLTQKGETYSFGVDMDNQLGRDYESNSAKVTFSSNTGSSDSKLQISM